MINGSGPSQNSFLLDGSDINDASNTTPTSASGEMLGVDTLREFRVLANSYSAAYGRSAGGVVSAVTRSGTNQVHGSFFEFIRNSDVDAKNYFDSHTAPIPPLRRNQFGVEADGPNRQEIFMTSYEGLRWPWESPTLPLCPAPAPDWGTSQISQPAPIRMARSAVSAWLFRIAANKIADRWERLGRERAMDRPPETEADPW